MDVLSDEDKRGSLGRLRDNSAIHPGEDKGGSVLCRGGCMVAGLREDKGRSVGFHGDLRKSFLALITGDQEAALETFRQPAFLTIREDL